MSRTIAVLGGALLLAGCVGASGTARPAAGYVPVPRGAQPPALARVMGQDAHALVSQFGEPSLDVHEGTARKLQFESPICVLDAYLYPERQGREPRVTHIDARQRNGSPIDESSCVAALDANRRSRK